MDCRPVLESIARLLPGLPDVEDQLVVFDSLVRVSEPKHRGDAARMLREAAVSSGESRRVRLMAAAESVAAGLPCAFTPEGLSAKEAAAAQTVTQEEWEEHMANAPLPPPPGPDAIDEEEVEEEAEDEEEGEAAEEEDFLAEPPPALPHLPVRHFFQGAVLCVAQGFTDSDGRVLEPGEVLRVLRLDQTESECAVSLLVGSLRLTAGHATIENAGNAWFQPVPTGNCMAALWEAVDSGLMDAEEDEAMDDHIDRLEKLREDVDACEDWLRSRGKAGDPPDCRSGPLSARVFGRDSAITYWVRLLFAGVKVVRFRG